MLDQLHAAGFPFLNPAGLVKEDSRMGWTCPCCSLGMGVLEEYGSPPGPAFSALPQGVHVWGIQMISLCFASLMTHQMGHNLPPPLPPGSIALFLSSKACFFYIAKQMSICSRRMCSACFMAAPAHACFGNTPRWSLL